MTNHKHGKDLDSLTIRPGKAADAEMLASLAERAFVEAFGPANTPENMARYLAKSFHPTIQARELAQPGARFLILEAAGTPVGYAYLVGGSTETCITGSNPVELNRFYLVQDWVGQGAGSRLMQACLEEARQAGHDTIWLGVWEKNHRAIAFYRKWGFVEVGRHPFLLGEDLQEDLVMQRKL